MKKLAIFASGNGSNFQAIYESMKAGEIEAEISFVFTDKVNAGVIDRAKSVNIPVYQLAQKDFKSKEYFEQEILKLLNEYKVDFIILAGYMRLVGETLLSSYENRIINIHPSLLPAFAGKDAIGQAFRANVLVTGITVHYVDAGMDTGPIIAQQVVEVNPDETIESLEAKIHRVEHIFYPQVIKDLVSK